MRGELHENMDYMLKSDPYSFKFMEISGKNNPFFHEFTSSRMIILLHEIESDDEYIIFQNECT